jgi:hypothetical protein
MIRDVIGPGGKVIRGIIEQMGLSTLPAVTLVVNLGFGPRL